MIHQSPSLLEEDRNKVKNVWPMSLPTHEYQNRSS